MKIFFTGKMASGKTSLANYLVQHRNFKRISLADPIKEIELDLESGMSPPEIVNKHLYFLAPMQMMMFCKIIEEAKLIPREEPKPRKRLQFIGTEGGRMRVADDIWIRLAKLRASDYENVCIDDVRFLNEFDYFTAAGWLSIAVLVMPSIQWKRLLELYGKELDITILNHASERGVEDILSQRICHCEIDTSLLEVEISGNILLERLHLYDLGH